MKNLNILIDNRPSPANRSHLLTEHGLAIWFEKDQKKWLIDTGASAAFIQNAEQLGIPVSQADYLVLSHNHNDHTGGLEDFFKHNTKAAVHASEWIKKSTCYSMKEETPKEISTNKKWLNDYAHRFVWHPQENVYLTEHVALLGNIPSDYPLPAGNKTLYWQYNKEFLPDPFHHELAVLIHSGCGDIVISSCTHKGILNTLQAAKNFSGKAPLYFIGGLHLKDGMEPEQGIARMAKILNTTYPGIHIYTGHCTDDKSFDMLKIHMQNKLTLFHSGYPFGQFCQQIM